ncbi:glycolate oxidase subunit GlcE [Azospirillum sp. RWY-5-1]|uniref:Glycolate oxidase subunit GlcE n=1 Tax=Azospirillum oleiclasticum TaxID=2735135 RepID=A0ABX2TBW2_9PROT|nr:glycolate oxidase subunit GlcE [Azospirillum oleiclasticum]NYZ14185.1 glycolate oxidase subunit GlcE [Azospirillum oleiclasticum]NYZ21669.1 glycolate oxidase subunit GlcE [Azospirillum oleiclasticum]
MTISTFRPETAAQAADAVRWALSNAEPLEVLGRGSKRGLGRPVQAAHAIDLSAMTGIVAYAPEELVLTVRAGTPMAEVQALLAENRQQLAFEPPDLAPLYGGAAGEGTIGGLVAAGLAGPRRIKDGSCRDHTLGFEAVNGRAEVYKAGGKVVKNVTGYDVPKLIAGSFGTLSVLTEVTVKVLPAPETSATMLVLGREPDAALRVLTQALQSPYEVSGAAFLPAAVAARSGVAAVAGAGGSAALVRLEGFGPSVTARAAALRDELGCDGVLDAAESAALWAEIRDVSYFSAADRPLWKLSVPPASGPAVAAALQASVACELYLDWGGGLVWAAVDGGDGAEAVRAAVGANGHATLMRAPESVRASVPVFHPQPAPVAALTQRVKASFDPAGIFNPGRMHAGV